MWPPEDAWRAPVGDFPPPWASSWGDDLHGLWADLTVNGVTQRMRWIEPSGPQGFLMGAPQAERDAIQDKNLREWANAYETKPMQTVIQHGFWLADTPCTQGFWQAVMGSNPSYFQKQPDSDLLPVESVDWAAVEQFVERFATTPEWGCADRLGLPTEVQWEYAARAGTTTAYWWGNALDASKANMDMDNTRTGNEKQGTTPVDQYPPNPWGLFDMHGNVWEWCADLWRKRLDEPEVQPEQGARVVRGGSWISPPGPARSAYRSGRPRGDRYLYLGFRFALRSSSTGGADAP